MANISELQKLAGQLGLTYMAGGDVDLNNETLSNLDYLKYVLETELAAREREALARRRKSSHVPHKAFDRRKLNKGVAWQIEQLETLKFIEDAEDLIIIGRCDSGKTSLAAYLGELALKAGERVVYYNVDDFLQILRNKDKFDKYHRKFNYLLSCSVIIIDELMYVALSEDDLPLFYRAINFIKEERSVIFITNRELSEWQQTAEDKHLMQTLADKISSDSQLIRLS